MSSMKNANQDKVKPCQAQERERERESTTSQLNSKLFRKMFRRENRTNIINDPVSSEWSISGGICFVSLLPKGPTDDMSMGAIYALVPTYLSIYRLAVRVQWMPSQ